MSDKRNPQRSTVIGVDVGGTFTDLFILDEVSGDVRIVKVPSTRGEEARGFMNGIARSGGGINESFTVRKISYGEGVERVFPIYSPLIDSIKVIRRGKVRRAKLYYLRDRRGKSARIVERKTGHGTEQSEG